MNLRHLEHLLALADTGSFSRAAEKCHITQSALSRGIKALEEELGGQLVDRIGKRNEFTPLGLSVLERARRIVHEAAELQQGAALLQQGSVDGLRVGLGSGPAAVLMTPWLVHMACKYPRARVAIHRGRTELQLVQLRARELDALVVDMRRVVPSPDLRIEILEPAPAGFVCRRDHPLLSHNEEISFDQLAAYPLASPPVSSEVARIFVAHYGPAADPSVMVTLECEDIASLIEVVLQTDAIYLGILGAVRNDLDGGPLAVLPMNPPLKASAIYGLITLEGRTERPVMEEFRRFIALANPFRA